MIFDSTYNVAGHRFRMTVPQSKKLCEALDRQYGPFEEAAPGAAEGGFEAGSAPKAPQTPLLFDLQYVTELPEADGERTCVYDRPAEGEEIIVRIYTVGDKWLFEVSVNKDCPVSTRIFATKDFTRAWYTIESKLLSDAVFAVNNAAMLIYAFATAPYATVLIHASVIGYMERAYLFLGVSGTGKSTHSSLWLKNIPGTELMNDDNPVIRVFSDGADAASTASSGAPLCTAICYGSPWSGKTPCYRNVSAPIGAFVQIRQSPFNKIAKMDVLSSYAAIFSSISGIKSGRSTMSRSLNDSVSGILNAAPVYILDCLPDADAAFTCNAAVTAPYRDRSNGAAPQPTENQ